MKQQADQPWYRRVDTLIFGASFGVILSFFIWAQSGSNMGEVMKQLLGIITGQFGWLYLCLGFGCVLFACWLGFGPYGNIKLGHDDDKPEFSDFSWFAMLFACGYGVGLVYWGAAEPLYFYSSPPLGVAANTTKAAEIALSYSYFHWGWTPWAMYLTITIPVGYFTYRKGMSPRFSSSLAPIIGRHHRGPLGKLIDSALVIGLVGGITTSIGLGIIQLVSGMEGVFGISSEGKMIYVAIGVVWCAIFTASAVSGVDKGIKWLSSVNIPLAICLMIFVFFATDTRFNLDLGVNAFGDYLTNFFKMSFWTDPIDRGGFPQSWTIFYWAWWFACAPILGIFTARISRGRTIRQVVAAHMIFAPIATWMWFMTFGGSALNYEIKAKAGLVALMGEKGTDAVIYALIDKLPLSGLVATLFMVLIIVFLSTSADSAAFVCAQVSTRDDQDPQNPPKGIRAVWAILMGMLSMVLVIVGKGITGLQLSSIAASFFVVFVMAGMAFSLVKALRSEPGTAVRIARESEPELEAPLDRAAG